MKTVLSVGFVLSALAIGPVFANGDPEKGQKTFNKCKSCHMVVDDAGEAIVKGGKTGPNLWAVVGRTAGTADFNYSKFMVSAGEAGLIWDEEQFSAYVKDPTKFLRAYLDDKKARGKMVFKLPKAQDAADIWAFLSSVSPEVETSPES